MEAKSVGTISSLGSEPGWRMGFTVIGVMCLAIAATAWFWLPESKLWRAALDAKRRGIITPHVEESRQDSNPRPRRRVTGAIFLTICTTGVFAASYSYITFAPTFLRETLGTNLGVSTIVLTVGTLLGIASLHLLAAQTVLTTLIPHCRPCAGLSGFGGALAHHHGCAGACALAASCGEASTYLGLSRAGVGQGLSEFLMMSGRAVSGGRRVPCFEALVFEPVAVVDGDAMLDLAADAFRAGKKLDTPSTVPVIPPRPPKRLVSPMTTAVMLARLASTMPFGEAAPARPTRT